MASRRQKLVPADPQGDDMFGFLRGKVRITGGRHRPRVVAAQKGKSQLNGTEGACSVRCTGREVTSRLFLLV